MDDEAVTMPMAVAEGQVVAWAHDGRFLITGDDAAVDRFVAELEPRRRLRLSDVQPAADGLAALGAIIGYARTGGTVVQVDPAKWAQLVAQGVPDGTGAFLPSLRDGAGRFTELLRLRPVAGLPMLSLQTTLMVAALRMAIEDTGEQVEAIARDVADLRRASEAQEIGNLAGIYRALANARTEADRAGTISQATWDAIAPHEITVQQVADRLRALLHRTVQDLPVDEDAGTRHEHAERLLDEEVLGRNLRLLVLAEQSRLLWRSLKLEHIRRTELDALPHEADAARAMLEENAGADRRLVEALRTTVTALGRMGPLDGFRIFTKDELPKVVAQLRAQVDEFAATRQEQIDVWAPEESPTLGDAWSEVGARIDRAAGEARQAIGGWLENLGGLVRGDAAPTVKEPAEVQIEAGSDGTPTAVEVTSPAPRRLHHLRPVAREHPYGRAEADDPC